MLYTVISQYDVFYEKYVPCSCSEINGLKIEYRACGSRKIITSLFSTDPKTYLDKRYLPGRVLESKGD